MKLGAPEFPPGQRKKDEFFGDVETYRKQVAIRVPVSGNAERLRLEVTSQGCADVGVCYPPQMQKVEVRLAGLSLGASAAASGRCGAPQMSTPQFGGREVSGEPAIVSDEARFEQALVSGNFLLTLAIFFGAGILLTFTPCVLPMIPILSGIIVGESRAVAKAHAFALSVTYVLGMAVTYTAIGVAAALSGAFIAAALQNPWVLGAFAAIFVVLALSMFGFYDLQLPASLHSKVSAASSKLKGGELGAVALMGMLSAAIVSPCVAAPLAGALLYISQTRDAVLGGAALFSLALGMGVPLIVVGTTEGALLPKSRRADGGGEASSSAALLLGVAIWIVSPVIPVAAQMLAWAALLIVGAMYLHALDPLPHDASGLRAVLEGRRGHRAGRRRRARDRRALGCARSAPAARGPARRRGTACAGRRGPRFERVRTARRARRAAEDRGPAGDARFLRRLVRVVQGDGALHLQRREGQGAQLAQMALLQVDVTEEHPRGPGAAQAVSALRSAGHRLLRPSGREIPGLRVIGFQPADKFLQSLALARSSDLTARARTLARAGSDLQRPLTARAPCKTARRRTRTTRVPQGGFHVGHSRAPASSPAPSSRHCSPRPPRRRRRSRSASSTTSPGRSPPAGRRRPTSATRSRST